MKHKIHFIGIGGIGVSALAKYFLKKGDAVSGSDLVETEITKQLKAMGAQVYTGRPRASLVGENTELVIYSPAIPKTHAERVQARKQSVPELSYPQALGELTRKRFTIAVSGTHGKSTTTAMLGILLSRAGLDPTVIVGTKLKEFGDSNCRMGKSKYLIIEADEHFASFLNYASQIIILTSLEADHLDFYKTLSNLVSTFRKYVRLLPKDGVVVANKDDKNIAKVLRGFTGRVVWYSLKDKEAKKVRPVLQIPGNHNVANALAALKAARILGVPDKTSLKALSLYTGSWRRFEIFNLKTLDAKRYTLVSDYGHHPTEIRVTLQGTREKWQTKKIWLVYQPHQYQRTYYLFQEFVKALSTVPVDKLIVTDIYDVAGREEGNIKKKVSSEKLVQEIKKKKPSFEALYIPSLRKAESYIKENLRGGEVVMVMGAGNIYNLTLQLTSGS